MDVGVILEVDDDDQPVVGCVHDVYIVNGFQNNQILYYVSATFSCLLVESTVFAYQTELLLHNPVHIRRSRVLGLTKYIILPHATCIFSLQIILIIIGTVKNVYGIRYHFR